MATIENIYEQAQLSLATYSLDLQKGMSGSDDSEYISQVGCAPRTEKVERITR